jgi:tRNA (mo5U34)-methyltransferase
MSITAPTSHQTNAVAFADLRQRVDEIKWWHRIDLGQGIVTPGRDPTPQKLERLKLPDLTGKTVLDVGAWDGFFSFEAERQGARRVLATDSFCWSGPGVGTKAGFELAREVLSSNVEDREIDVLDLSPENVGVFDVVLFLGVLYHMRHPMLALEKVAGVTGELLVVETAVDMLHVRRPSMAFYPGGELKGDPTNWVGPNPAAVRGMLQSVGFRKVEVVYRDSIFRQVGRALRNKLKDRRPYLLRGLVQGRIVCHAWR